MPGRVIAVEPPQVVRQPGRAPSSNERTDSPSIILIVSEKKSAGPGRVVASVYEIAAKATSEEANVPSVQSRILA